MDFGDINNYKRALKVSIPQRIVDELNKIRKLMPADNYEYGVFLSGKMNFKTGTYEIDDDYYLPKQRATHTTIAFEEYPQIVDGVRKHNVVLHRHPSGVENFSPEDWANLNEEFDVSILFIPPRSFPMAIINVEIKGENGEFLTTPVEATVVIRNKTPVVDKELKARVTSQIETPKAYKRKQSDTLGSILGHGLDDSLLESRFNHEANRDLILDGESKPIKRRKIKVRRAPQLPQIATELEADFNIDELNDLEIDELLGLGIILDATTNTFRYFTEDDDLE